MTLFRRREREPSNAERARKKAELDLEATRARTPWYAAWGRTFVEIQEVNHLGLNAAKALRGDSNE